MRSQKQRPKPDILKTRRRCLPEFPAVVFVLAGILGGPQNSGKGARGAGSARGIRASKVEPEWGYPHLGSRVIPLDPA